MCTQTKGRTTKNMGSLKGAKSLELQRNLGLQTQHFSTPGTINPRKIKIREHDRERKREKGWGKEKNTKEGKERNSGKQKQQVEKTGRKRKEGEKEEGIRESDRQKGREISAGTVTNKSLQHDRRLLKHFISPQHNGVLLPIICSVSARVDIK